MSGVTKEAVSPLGTVILARLLWKADGETPKALDDVVKAVVQQQWTDAERTRAVEEEIAAFEQAGHVERRRKAAYALTDSGRKVALKALGLASPPAKKDWGAFKKHYLFARALDMPPTVQMLKADERGAAIVARYHGLSIGSKPTLTKVKHALAWRAVGVETDKPFTVTAFVEWALNKVLGTKKLLPEKEALALLVARAASAQRTGVEYVDKGILSRWIQGVEAVPAARRETPSPHVPTTTVGPTPVPPRAALPGDEEAFAALVIAAARAAPEQRFAGNKVFISHVLSQLIHEGTNVEDVRQFKARLVAAHRRGLLSLSRADLVDAMDPEVVSTSETQYNNATFHFVQV